MSAQGNPNLAGSWAIERGAAPAGRGGGGIGNFVVMTKRSMQGPTGPRGVEVKDVYSVAGDVLTIDRSLGRATQKLVYRKGAPR
jgi:hypothetical protein